MSISKSVVRKEKLGGDRANVKIFLENVGHFDNRLGLDNRWEAWKESIQGS